MNFDELWKDGTVRANVVLTVTLAIVIFVLQMLIQRFVRRANGLKDPERLAWLARVRFASGLALVAGVVLVWSTELHSLAISAVAIAAAIVLATKELIMCVSGGVVRQVSGAFDIGDRIELLGHRGDVVRTGLFSISMLEIGPGQQRTGRAVTMPNSILLSQPVVNESFTDDFVLHLTTVPFVPEAHWEEAERTLLAAAHAVCAEHLDEARRHMERKSDEYGLSAPHVEPRVFVQISGEAQRTLLIRFPAPARDRARLEQAILRAYRSESPDPAPSEA